MFTSLFAFFAVDICVDGLFIVNKFGLECVGDVSWFGNDDDETGFGFKTFFRYFLMIFWYFLFTPVVVCWVFGLIRNEFVEDFAVFIIESRLRAKRKNGKRSCLDTRWCFFIKWSVKFNTHVSQRGHNKRFLPSIDKPTFVDCCSFGEEFVMIIGLLLSKSFIGENDPEDVICWLFVLILIGVCCGLLSSWLVEELIGELLLTVAMDGWVMWLRSV